MKKIQNEKKFNLDTINELMRDNEFLQLFEEERLVSKFKEALSDIMDDKGWNKSEFATELGFSKSYVTQLLQGNKNISLRNVAKILFKVGKRLNIEIAELENDFERLKHHKECRVIYLEDLSRRMGYPSGENWKPSKKKMTYIEETCEMSSKSLVS